MDGAKLLRILYFEWNQCWSIVNRCFAFVFFYEKTVRVLGLLEIGGYVSFTWPLGLFWAIAAKKRLE